MVTLNGGIQNGTVALVTLVVDVALGAIETDDVVVPDEAVGVPEDTEGDPDESEGDEAPADEENEMPLLRVVETWEPVVLRLVRPVEPLAVLDAEGVAELTLLLVPDEESVVLGIDNETLVSVLVSTGAPGETELKDDVDTLAETLVEMGRVVKDVTGREMETLLALEDPRV